MFIPYGDDIEKRHPPFATIFIMAINMLVYLHEHQLFQQEPETASKYGEFIEHWGLIPHELATGKVMGLFSGMFLHADFMHLLGNMMTMWLFAWTMEVALGTIPFLVLYLFWGIAAGLTHAALDLQSTVPCVGASGAIFGIIGAYFVTFGVTAQVKCLWNGGIFTNWKFVKCELPAGAYVFFWMILPQVAGVLGVGEVEAENAKAGIAWYAHAGGFGAGAACMLIFGGDAMRRMRLNREGKWEIQQAVEEPAPSDELAGGESLGTEAVASPGTACQSCRTPMDESHKIDSTLYRCPNPECRRLTYVTAEAPAPARSRW
jgi:membrane associated rhomboid family serine protease